MAFLGAVGNIVSKVLPKVVGTVSNLLSTPVGQAGLNILKQLASSVFSKDGSGGLFSENLQLTLPNPLSRLNGLLGKIGSTVANVSDFLSRIGEFLQGNRTLENGTNVDVPALSDRAPVAAQQAAATAQAVTAGSHSGAIAQAVQASTASGSPASAGGSIVGALPEAAFSTAMSPDQKNMLSKVKDPTQRAQMEAQFQMQNYQNLMQFISNIMKIMGDTSRAIVSNIRS